MSESRYTIDKSAVLKVSVRNFVFHDICIYIYIYNPRITDVKHNTDSCLKDMFSFGWLKFPTSKLSKIIKDTHREKVPSIKTRAFTKRTSMGIWIDGTTNQLIRRGS